VLHDRPAREQRRVGRGRVIGHEVDRVETREALK
jgi:hypothetical protein